MLPGGTNSAERTPRARNEVSRDRIEEHRRPVLRFAEAQRGGACAGDAASASFSGTMPQGVLATPRRGAQTFPLLSAPQMAEDVVEAQQLEDMVLSSQRALLSRVRDNAWHEKGWARQSRGRSAS